MASVRLDQLRTHLAPIRGALLDHRVYGQIDRIECAADLHGVPCLRRLGLHVAAQGVAAAALLCRGSRGRRRRTHRFAAQSTRSCSARNATTTAGVVMPPFELYRTAMLRCGANTEIIDRFVEHLRAGSSVTSALEAAVVPAPIREFVKHTFAVIDGGDACAIASSFAFGREDLLPDIFRRIVEELAGVEQTALGDFRYYLDRHIELDGGQHGSLAGMLVEELCRDGPHRWRVAEDAAVQSLRARLRLWDCTRERLEQRCSHSF